MVEIAWSWSQANPCRSSGPVDVRPGARRDSSDVSPERDRAPMQKEGEDLLRKNQVTFPNNDVKSIVRCPVVDHLLFHFLDTAFVSFSLSLLLDIPSGGKCNLKCE